METFDATIRDVTKTISDVALPALRKFNALEPKTQRNLILGAGALGVAGTLGAGVLAKRSITKALAGAVASREAVTAAQTASNAVRSGRIGAGVLGRKAVRSAATAATKTPGALARSASLVKAGASKLLQNAGLAKSIGIKGAKFIGGKILLPVGFVYDVSEIGKGIGEGVGLIRDIGHEKAAKVSNRLNQERLSDLASLKAATARTPLAKLQAQRLGIDAQIASASKDKLDQLRAERRAVNDQIQVLKGRTKVEAKVETTIAKTIQAVKAATVSAPTISPTQQRAIDLEKTRLPSALRQSELAVLRAQRATAQIGPFGALGAFGETQALSKGIDKQIEILQEQAKLLNDGTTVGQINANILRASIEGLRAEQKSNLRNLQTAYLDNTLQQASKSGRFEKILITQQKNLMRGLQKDIIKLPDGIQARIAGSIDPNRPFQKSMTSMDVLKLAQPQPQPKKQIRVKSDQPDMATLLKSTAKAFNKAAALLSNEDIADLMGIESGRSRHMHIDAGS